jgi:hypothetical protein
MRKAQSQPKDYSGKAPFYQKWDEKAFSFDTMHLHWQARDLYRHLLQAAWHLPTRPDLPDDDDQLCSILGVPKEVWDTHRAAVRAMLTPEEVNGVRVLLQKRLRLDWGELEEHRQQQTDKANARWRKSNGNNNKGRNATAMPRHSHGNATAMPEEKSREEQSKVKSSREEKSKAEHPASENTSRTEHSSATATPQSKTVNPFDSPSDDQTKLDLTEPKPGADSAGKENSGDENQATVGDIPTKSLEETLTVLSDGELQTGILRAYSASRDVFESACRDAIEKFRDRSLTDRTVLATVLDDAMNRLEEHDIKWPKGFLKAKKTLDKGGPLQMALPKKQQVVFGDVFGSNSALNWTEWKNDLLPHREHLQKVADKHGVPQNFVECMQFLYHFAEYMVMESDESDTLDSFIEEIQSKVRVHIESETEKAVSRRGNHNE